MELEFNLREAQGYKSKSQIARVLTENWVKHNAYCPNCTTDYLSEFANNRPVADFFCGTCQEQFELKSKRGKAAKKIVDGAYSSMIERVSSDKNPNFFFLNYEAASQSVRTFLIIPKHFFTPQIIEKRKPLPATARRAGWQGCNIILGSIPESGKIFYVKDREIATKEDVRAQWRKTAFLQETSQKSKGWLLDILGCLERLPDNFQLKDMYAFEAQLQTLHPENTFVKDKIRQQLQVLRDKGYLEFVARGRYRKR